SSTLHGDLTLSPTGAFLYTPQANFYGLDSFTYRVSDGSLLSNPATVTITVTPVNDPPVANNDWFRTPRITPLHLPAYGVLDNDTDADSYDFLTAALVNLPTVGTLALN